MPAANAITVAMISHGRVRSTRARKREGFARSIRAMGLSWTIGGAVSIAYSMWRNVAAAANGPITTLIMVSAHRIVNGVPNRTVPPEAAFAAATPKISTGIVSG